jgi:hypothetical protein
MKGALKSRKNSFGGSMLICLTKYLVRKAPSNQYCMHYLKIVSLSIINTYNGIITL